MRQPQRKRKSGLIILILLFAVGAIIAASIVVPKFTSPIKSVVKRRSAYITTMPLRERLRIYEAAA